MAAYEWHCLTMDAEFEPRDGAGLLSFKGRLWMLGGWNPWSVSAQGAGAGAVIYSRT